MDELNRPLGQKSESLKKQKGALSDNNGKWIGLLGLLTGFSALLIVGWLVIFPTRNEMPQTNDVASNQTVSKTDPQPVEVTVVDQAPAVSDSTANNSGETGLTALQPNGSIAVPKPRPPRAKPQEIGLAHLPDPELVERGAIGVIPKRSKDGRRPMDVYGREPDTTGNFGVARVVIIIGGMGVSQTSTQQAIKKLPGAVTLAFAPYGNSLARWMQAARKKGHELLLQIPMEPFGYPQNSPGPHTIVSGVSKQENLANLHWAMSRITNYVGVMNYQGGKLLSDPDSLKPIFDDLAERGLLFVDDGSSASSHARKAAQISVLPFAANNIILDGKRTRRDIAKQINLLIKQAKRTGMAIGFANGFSDTIDMISEFVKKAADLGIEITPVSAVVSDPEREN